MSQTENSFQQAYQRIQNESASEAEKGARFETLIRSYFQNDKVYQSRFSNVWKYVEWANLHPEYSDSGSDAGVDLVAQENETGRFCAIQVKCYAPDAVVSKRDLDAFIAASSNPEIYGSRILVTTGKELTRQAQEQLRKKVPIVQEIYRHQLEESAVDWSFEKARAREPFKLRPHQKQALKDVLNGFKEHDRGQMIMACGTGKTFAALRIAEETAGKGGRVLYLVPSIALFGQAMREWAEQAELNHRYIGVCSDKTAGKTDEDANVSELEIPVTTDREPIQQALLQTRDGAMTVVFSTYHSLPVIAEAQANGAPEFDLAVCDEAHRTAGRADSHFTLIHDKERIRAVKRLFMTATPRVYTDAAKTKAGKYDLEIVSMDEAERFGPEFHRLNFSAAVKEGLLSDYKVVVFAVTEPPKDGDAPDIFLPAQDGRKEVNITDATKIIGCWKALHNPEFAQPGAEKQLQRAIAFTNTIRNSKAFQEYFQPVVERALEMEEEQNETAENENPLPREFEIQTEHVDGTDHALTRKNRIEWLKRDPNGDAGANSACRILSNARCLSEGVDVPALDAVIFLEPKKSHIDIVQAVGRVMRKLKGGKKTHGYIILPVACPADADSETILDGSAFHTVWEVLKALRSHDDRLNAQINSIDLSDKDPDRIQSNFLHEEPDPSDLYEQGRLFSTFNIPLDRLYAKIVEKCGDRKYWENWAKDIADIFQRLCESIDSVLNRHETLQTAFQKYRDELRQAINPDISAEDARDMLAQHILTRPVFNAVFKDYDFANRNPVANALETLNEKLNAHGFEDQTESLQPFYESVQNRAAEIDNPAAKQTVLKELYEKFFKTAFKKDADRLGIVYTPIEIIDFILHSADDILRNEFGASLSSEGVHILDPFAGAGLFHVRLLQSDLIKDEDLQRKYRKELHANEIMLLAYYIAAVNIEEAYRGRLQGENPPHEPFGGIVLTDTFDKYERPENPYIAEPADRPADKRNPAYDPNQTRLSFEMLKENAERQQAQQNAKINVVVGNPPWSAGQRSAADNNQNQPYPEMEQRIRETYVALSNATLKNSLYDSYKKAFRWASDRIGNCGIAAFVTNASWIEGNAESGVRACFADEFTSIYVLHLRGDLRTSGEQIKREGGNIFGVIRTPSAVALLVKNPDAKHDGCRIHYRALDDYLSTEEKRESLNHMRSVNSAGQWDMIKPNKSHEWLNQRSEEFQTLYSIGTKEAKSGKADNAIVQLYSQGLATSRDAYLYNFSYEKCAENARLLANNYLDALDEIEPYAKPTNDQIDAAAQNHSSNVRWDRELKNNLKRKKKTQFDIKFIQKAAYRPFVATNCYADFTFVNCKYQLDRVYPILRSYDPPRKNRAICVTGRGSKIPFSTLITDTLPDLSVVDKSQWVPRYRYETASDGSLERIDNIADSALSNFRKNYADDSISKDDIFYYVYGILHSPEYRKRFANDLSKELPRVPYAPDFRAFSAAGLQLAELHLHYETCEEYPLRLLPARLGGIDALDPRDCKIVKKMKFADKTTKETLIVNSKIALTGIPPEAHRYVVNGRTPLEWLIDRYQVKTDARSGIVNDANAWFADDPRELLRALRRAVYLSVESVKIIASLPSDIGV